MTSSKIAIGLAAASLALSGCAAISHKHLSRGYGESLRQNIASQIADPDARYVGDPDPGADSGRVALAIERYRTGKVIEPQASASEIGMSATGGGGQK